MTTGPGWVRPSPTEREARWDVATGVLLAVGVVLSTALSRDAGIDPGSLRPGQVEEVGWALAVALPLCLRRRFPLSSLVVCAVAFIGLQLRYVGDATMTSVCLFAAVYTAGAWGRDRRRATVVRAVVVAALAVCLGYVLTTDTWAALNGLDANRPAGVLPPLAAFAVYTVATNALFLSAAWVFGDAAWVRTRQRAELAERNRELRVERDENARNAVVAERFRIARELHDVVAHHVSVMGVQAGAARLTLTRDPDGVGRVLSSIEAAGRDAIEEMHRLLGVLRDSGQPEVTAPAPGVERLAALVAQPRGDLATTCAVVGEPRELPRSLSISLYRIAQEALTNTVKHANATRADVVVEYGTRAVELVVTDDGRGPTDRDGTREGLGHKGMRERVALHDGTLTTGPDGRGYAVRARFPLP
ncbi:sensor histidine kinase [Umezawaea tangerina]|uniref:histidine kinase n=1 Tax=Umezawaea tangerina TaxID=84725 RepID=A0A2T0SQD4_9PSEU|nr:sensor histidine kinase [Umezawaea tangerina]PRY35627.1 histidine kinase [Umezawaea tangerina]